MSDAKRCNRCGEYYDLNPKNLPGTKTGPKYSINYYKQLGYMGAEVKSFDLCPECARQFTEWAENPNDVFLFKGEDDDEKYQPSYLRYVDLDESVMTVDSKEDQNGNKN